LPKNYSIKEKNISPIDTEKELIKLKEEGLLEDEDVLKVLGGVGKEF
jgi:hypothetical protein